jgi:hypothetical protein
MIITEGKVTGASIIDRLIINIPQLSLTYYTNSHQHSLNFFMNCFEGNDAGDIGEEL